MLAAMTASDLRIIILGGGGRLSTEVPGPKMSIRRAALPPGGYVLAFPVSDVFLVIFFILQRAELVGFQDMNLRLMGLLISFLNFLNL